MSEQQPMPVRGERDVTPEARRAFGEMLNARQAAGIATYGRSLQTWNGRDAHRDLAEELIDAWQYATQAAMERRDLEERLATLSPVVGAAVRLWRVHLVRFAGIDDPELANLMRRVGAMPADLATEMERYRA